MEVKIEKKKKWSEKETGTEKERKNTRLSGVLCIFKLVSDRIFICKMF